MANSSFSVGFGPNRGTTLGRKPAKATKPRKAVNRAPRKKVPIIGNTNSAGMWGNS